MATATKQTVPPTPVVEVVKSITLVLSPAEAVTLAVITAKVGGSPDHSPREHASAIHEALYGVGIRYAGSDEYASAVSNSQITFNNYPRKLEDDFPF